MEFYGRIKEICPLETGKNERGTWQRQAVVVESFENPNNFLAIDAIGERIQQLGTATEASSRMSSPAEKEKKATSPAQRFGKSHHGKKKRHKTLSNACY